jgi:hypothetical protein
MIRRRELITLLGGAAARLSQASMSMIAAVRLPEHFTAAFNISARQPRSWTGREAPI